MSELSATRFDIVRIFDPAIVNVNSAGAIAEYAATRDMSKLTIEDGRLPIIFRCRGLTRDQRADVRDQRTDARKYMLAFRYGLVSIDQIDRPDGTLTDFAPHRHNAKDALTPDVLDELEQRYGFKDEDFLEVGSAILGLSFLARGVPPRCPLPDSSVHAVDTLRSRRAARSQEHVESPSSAPSKRRRKEQSDPTG